MIEKAGIKIGIGTCNIMNTIRDKSDELKKNYEVGDKTSVKDYVVNLANTIGRGGVSLVAHTVDAAKNITKTETYGQIKEFISKAYETTRDGYRNYLTKSADKIHKEITDQTVKNEDVKLSTRFKYFVNNMAQKIDSVYSTGEKAVSKTAKSLSTQASEIKKSDAYQKLVAKRDQMDANDANNLSQDGPNVDADLSMA